MTGTDPLTAIVDQLAAHAEQLTRLDTREADHHATLSGQLAELPADEEELEPDFPDYVPAEWLPGDGTSFPWS